MKKILYDFQPILSSLMKGHKNVVLGGSRALLLHGLNITRPVEDLDVIIYKPSLEQKKLLQHLQFFDIVKNRPAHLVAGYTDNMERILRVIKLKKNNSIIDIISEETDMPEDLLYYKHDDIMYPIQNIQKVIDAKNSYRFQAAGELPLQAVGKAVYGRMKDVEDLMDLKNSNFNL